MSHINSPIHVGKSALCSNIGSNEKIIHGMNLLCLRPLLSVNADYVHLYFRSDVFKQQISPYIQNAVNQASINIKNLSGILCPIPPIDSQLRIVERCSNISILIESIEESLL